jgi:hypothetical protein
VANCWAPHVIYIPAMKKYVMMGSRGCVGFYTSDDGINWENPTLLFKIDDIPLVGHEIAMHPGLYIERITAKDVSGYLFYAYSPKYGDKRPSYTHHFVKRTITFKIGEGGDAESLKKKLAGTKWINSNKVSFEWTTDGRFLHKGVEREWKALDGKQAQIILGPDHKDTLVFHSGFTEFSQFVKGGPTVLQGKRVKNR